MILVPYVGVPLYLVLGGRKLRRVIAKKPQMGRLGAPDEGVEGNEIEIFPNGEATFASLTGLLRGARTSIRLSTFILKADATGRAIMEILAERARAGVEVRVLLDGLGSFWMFPWRLRKLRASGACVSIFLPMVHVPFFGHSNLRNHRKMVIVDGENAIVGGMNLAMEYLGSSPSRGRWKDLSLRIAGPAVPRLASVFEQDWAFASHDSRPPPADARGLGSERVRVIASGPDVEGDPLYDTLLEAAFGAWQRIWIATPYFIPDEALSKALEIAARRGVDVRVLVPRRSNHRLADLCRGSYLAQLDRAGARIHFHAGMMHAKTVLIDSDQCIVGSANLDIRSLFLNFELGVQLLSPASIEAMEGWFKQALAEAPQGRIKRGRSAEFFEGVGRLLSPIL
jgi:cardiolipin synthase